MGAKKNDRTKPPPRPGSSCGISSISGCSGCSGTRDKPRADHFLRPLLRCRAGRAAPRRWRRRRRRRRRRRGRSTSLDLLHLHRRRVRFRHLPKQALRFHRGQALPRAVPGPLRHRPRLLRPGSEDAGDARRVVLPQGRSGGVAGLGRGSAVDSPYPLGLQASIRLRLGLVPAVRRREAQALPGGLRARGRWPLRRSRRPRRRATRSPCSG